MNIQENYKTRLQQLAGLTEGKHNHKNEYGALMLKIEYENWQEILDLIDKEDLYDEEPGYGLEKEPHVTVLFGFHKKTDYNQLKSMVKDKVSDGIEIKVKGITHFETDDYDVVKFDIESKMMHTLNKLMTDNFDYTNSFPDYHPHMTIAYVKKGTGKKYDDKSKEIKMTSNKFIWSPADGNKKFFTI